MTDEIPALSTSIAHVLLSESPKHAWTIHRLLGNQPRPTTEGQERGQLLHALLLGGASIEIIDAKDFRTKKAREQRDAARAAGKIPIVKSKADEYFSIAERFKQDIASRCGIRINEWETELRVEWIEPTLAGNDAVCHGVIDLISPDNRRIVDVKTFPSGRATRERCIGALIDSHGLLQARAYPRAIEQMHPELMGRTRMEYLFLEMTSPFDIRHAELSGTLLEIAAQQWHKAVDQWSFCLTNDRWPGFVDEGMTRLEAPAWLMAKELGNVEEDDD